MVSDKERLKAAASGQKDWGVIGDAINHQRYVQLLPGRYRNRRRCWCGCGNKITHGGYVNGLAMTSGCEWSMRQWVKDPVWHVKRQLADLHARVAGGTPTGEYADICPTCSSYWPCDIARALGLGG